MLSKWDIKWSCSTFLSSEPCGRRVSRSTELGRRRRKKDSRKALWKSKFSMLACSCFCERGPGRPLLCGGGRCLSSGVSHCWWHLLSGHQHLHAVAQKGHSIPTSYHPGLQGPTYSPGTSRGKAVMTRSLGPLQPSWAHETDALVPGEPWTMAVPYHACQPSPRSQIRFAGRCHFDSTVMMWSVSSLLLCKLMRHEQRWVILLMKT